MENLITITPNCFIVRTQAGFKKLLKKFDCYHGNHRDGHHNGYYYELCQITDDENAIETSTERQVYNEKGEIVLKSDGTPKTYIYNTYKQYPIKYPCIISIQDETFEIATYYMYIRYVFDDLTIKDFKDMKEICHRII